MTCRTETIDVGAGMAWAVVAPALAGALVGLAGGPGLAFIVFTTALSIALAHVALLALPLYGLMCVIGWRVGAVTALVAAGLIGALPATFLFGPGVGAWGGLFGLVGGAAFCAVSLVRSEPDE